MTDVTNVTDVTDVTRTAETADADERSTIRFECDLIMKGGITSGVVYPPAICEIARDHRLRSIGGSSAGAIAAASAAAAELGRYSTTGGFDALREIPGLLAETDRSGRTRLQRLFQPDVSTADLFDLFWTVRSTGGQERITAVAKRLLRLGRVPRLLDFVGAIASLGAIAVLLAATSAGEGWGIGASIGLLLVVGGLWLILRPIAKTVTGGLRLAKGAPTAAAANFHGICNGRTPAGSSDAALTDWLHETLQTLAGRNDEGVGEAVRRTPVTYGELRRVGVDLLTTVTDLTHGTAETLPLTTGAWAFHEAEMRALFPKDVVDHMVGHAGETLDTARQAALDAAGLCALPDPDDVPILIGARASLSFPLLLSAVPLYTWEPVMADGGWDMRFQRSWLSDGGITSNLPVHLFDKPLPGRPTYAINLGGGGVSDDGGGDLECRNIWRPLLTGAGRLPDSGPIETTAQLLGAVLDTMQNWSDNSLMRAPGFRDRICTVRLGPGEGGLNLDMSAQTIHRLAARGTAAGDNLAWMQRGDVQPRCGAPPGSDADKVIHQWERHRFIRYRTFVGGLARYLIDARSGFGGPDDYSTLTRRAVTERWFPYRVGWTRERSEMVDEVVRKMLGFHLEEMERGTPAGTSLGFKPVRSRDAAGEPPEASESSSG